MRHTTEVSELSGFNESPVGGDFIVSSNREFTSRHVTVGVSVLYNKSKSLNAVVSAVTDTRIDATGTNFSPGDLYLVTLSANWTLQNSDGPVIEIECKRCGWSYPKKDLIQGLCKVCVDKPRTT